MGGFHLRGADGERSGLEPLVRAFADKGWPEWIDNPFTDGPVMDRMMRLGETVKNLNRTLRTGTIRFSADGHGGVRWFVVKKKRKAKKG